MSDDNHQSPKTNPLKTQPIKKISVVPLRKETVRVTLKAPGARPGVPTPPPFAPAPTIPLGGGVPVARPAPVSTIPLGGGGPKPVVAEPTVQLERPGTIALTQPLPKATVQLQQTQQLTQGLGSPSQAATIQIVSEDDVESRRGSKVALPLSIVAFLITLLVGFFAVKHAGVWVEKPENNGGYSKLFELAE